MIELKPRYFPGRYENIYAIIETGGKQYRVSPGDTIDVDRLSVPSGGGVELDRVLVVGDAGDVTVGRPLVSGARVLADVVGHGRDKKVIVFKYKNKTRYQKKTGHRQGYTRLNIKEIVMPQSEASSPSEEVADNGA